MAEIGQNIELCKSLLTQNEVIGIPTETVYGLAGNALSQDAVLKIFEVKERPSFDPLICHIKSIDDLGQYAITIPDLALRFAEAFWPGPLTLILPKNKQIPDLVTSGLDTCGFRVPKHPLTLQLLNSLDFPLAAPSANPFGYISPTSAQHVQNQLGDKIPYILDGGECQVGLESTIVGFNEEGRSIVYRLGGLSLDEIKKIDPEVLISINQSSNPVAPGQLKSHYSPQKPIILFDRISELEHHPLLKESFVISFSQDFGIGEKSLVLTSALSLNEAAKNLFAYLRLADEDIETSIIFAQRVPGQGLGLAINDRLKRATS
jgi:L-threonylcarbamoyladenylate synthase